MRKHLFKLIIVIVVLLVMIEGKKISRSRSSGRSSSKKTNYNPQPQPAPTSFSNPHASAPKPTLFGWQEKTAQKSQSSPSRQSNPHSYPSNTGLSGNTQPKQHQVNQDTAVKSNVPQQQSAPRPESPNQMGHSYPVSNSLSGNSGTGNGHGYPQGTGLSGTNVAAPSHQAINPSNTYRTQNNYQNSGGAPPAYTNVGNNNNPHPAGAPPSYTNVGNNNYHHPAGAPPSYTNMGNNNYQHPAGAPPSYTNMGHNHYNQGPPPPYSNYGGNYGGYGSHGGYGQQMPGYFGGYSNHGKGFGGVGRSSSTLAGVGIAGAGIGTILTGLALWNLARSTGHHQHTVIYDRGQPVAVAPAEGTAPVVDPILGDLENCSLTINTDNSTDVIAIPCSIATSFTPDADVKDVNVDNPNDNTKCIITVNTKSGKEFMTTIPCAVLLKSAAENNVTENIAIANENASTIANMAAPVTSDQPAALKLVNDKNGSEHKLNCPTLEPGDIRDPINPCFSVHHDLSVIPYNADMANSTDKVL